MFQEEHIAQPLLGADDPPVFERWDFGSGRSMVVVCDHARNSMPRSLGTLGLAENHLTDHIAWDIGAEGVARGLAERLEAPLVLGGYSRLVVDLNRAKSDVSAIPPISDGVLVPGNLSLDEVSRRERFAVLHDAYHAAVDRVLEENTSPGRCPVMIAVHSFTPQVSGVRRPWHAGILWNKDHRVALKLLAALRADGDVLIGDNEPYSGRHPADYTIDSHAELRGFAHAGIEIRQDLIHSPQGQRDWAERLYAALTPILQDPRMFSRLDGGGSAR
jgi:predicted N-formylglutamate amidohydrolase